MQKNIRINANTRQHLNDSTISPTGASHKHLHINPNEKNTGKESRLPCSASTHSSTASRLSCLSCLASTCLSCNVRFSTRVSLKPRPLLKPRALLEPRAFLTHVLFHVRFAGTSSRKPLSLHSLSHHSGLQPFRPALFWARFSISANGESTPPLPPAFPRFGSWQMRMMRICCYVIHAGVSAGHLAALRKTRLILMRICCGRFGGTSRRRHAASPSVPRGV